MGLFSAVTGIIAAKKQKKASKKAEKARIAAMEKAIGEQSRQFDITSGQYAPYREFGAKGLAGYGDLLGLGGADAQNAAIEQLRQSPFYQSLYRTGEEAVLQNAAATGGIRGGNTQRSLADFGADTLMQTIEHQLQGLGGAANLGFSAVGQLGQFGADKARAVADLLTGQGEARASGLLTRGGITAGMWNGIGGGLDSLASAAAGAFIPGAGAGGGFGGFVKGIL